MKDRLIRWWVYFRRGHSTYLTFLLSFLNFIVIQYKLVIESIPSLYAMFPNLIKFVVIFLLIYPPMSVLVGWLDFKKGAVPVESAVGALASPWAKDVARSLSLICEGRYEEAKKILEKWVEEK